MYKFEQTILGKKRGCNLLTDTPKMRKLKLIKGMVFNHLQYIIFRDYNQPEVARLRVFNYTKN